ncbi:MAG TPA: PBP1A family penicillin-binding protein [Thermoanaerobaculia bacterium]|nr:PBP1A family penicillin-binding protein [Thermoanaerobaculia bacterium]
MSSPGAHPRHVSLPVWVARHKSEVVLGAAAFLLLAVALVGFVEAAVASRFDSHRWNLPSRIYSDVTVLEPGDSGSADRLVAKLERLFYRAAVAAPDSPGHFRRDGDTVDVYSRDFVYPGREFHGYRAAIEFTGNAVTSIRDEHGDPLPALVVEPERLGSVFGEEYEDRTLVRLGDVPRTLVDAILVTEDRDFYRHSGVSIKRTFGAILATLRGGAVQGGSTLTQQLVKNLYLTPERTVRRKAVEATIAILLDARYSKDEILEAYLNEIYLGQRGSIAIKGVGEASRFYFGKQVGDLDLAESATIAGMIKAPNAYSPFRSAQRTRERRDLVLGLMLEQGKIDRAALEAAVASPLVPRRPRIQTIIAPHFVDFVKAQLSEKYGEKMRTEGLQIYTTLDVDLQQAGQRAVTDGLASLEKRYRRLAAAARRAPLQAALIQLEPQTGAVKALVGGRDYRLSQFNRVTQAHRQPGSLFKPFVMLAAFTRRDLVPPVTPATMLIDSPITVQWGRRRASEQWTPRNYDGGFRGAMSVRRAVELSINIPTVRAALAADLTTVLAASRAAGIASRMEPYPSVALGAFEISPMEIASAYAVLANGGVRIEPNAIVGVLTSDGRILDRKDTGLKQVLPADAVFLVDSILRGAVDRGTAAGARAGGLRGVLAGKTGTTNDGRDAWFVGFSPRFLATIWVGYDDNRGLNLSGSQAAVPIFADFSRSLPPQLFAEGFPVPSDVVTAEIDPDTGYLFAPGCPRRMTEVFISGTAPTELCPVHQGWYWQEPEPYPTPPPEEFRQEEGEEKPPE